MLKPSTNFRSQEEEIMDNFDLRGQELEQTLKDLERINSWLGGNAITKAGIRKFNPPMANLIKIVDIGCGSGGMLRKLSEWGKRKGFEFEFIGVDANPYAIEIARELSRDYQNIKFLEMDIFSKGFEKLNYDILLCTLTLHHFKDFQIPGLLQKFYKNASMGIVINDLQRSKIAYFLFKLFCAVFVRNNIAVKDGLISILRGFKKNDINKYMNTIKVNSYSVSWQWAFRYLWVIKKDY